MTGLGLDLRSLRFEYTIIGLVRLATKQIATSIPFRGNEMFNILISADSGEQTCLNEKGVS